MVELIVIGFVAGIVAGISPCILPVLPVILVAGATTPATAPVTTPATGGSLAIPAGRLRPGGVVPSWWWRRFRGPRARPVAVVAGLIVSFSLLVLAGSEILSALGLPQDFLRDAGITLLVLIGIGLLFPPLAHLLERPFARIGGWQPNGKASGFVVGLALGVLFVPCAGPILAAITVVGATHHVGLTAVFLTFAFAAGAGVPLLAVAIAGSELTKRVRGLRRQGPRIRQFSGVVLIVMALTIGFNVFAGLQRDVPGYTSALQSHIEGSAKIRRELSDLTGSHTAAAVSLSKCNPNATALVDCGPAPNFTGITTWLNTPGDLPLSLTALRGKVVLVDFWTYSCINCQRSLPHVEAWHKQYAGDGFVVVGVHTPEFAFEHVVANVRSQAAALGVHYPVAIDDNYKTWSAYDNEYWPADYLIDAQGVVRHVHFGEGDYANTESLIRDLLGSAHPGLKLAKPIDVPDKTPTGELSPETYIGYQNLQYLAPGSPVKPDEAADYHFPASLQLGELGLSGTWTDDAQEATAGADARLELGFLAQDVYLVLGGQGTLTVSINGKATKTIAISGIPKLYTLFEAKTADTAVLSLRASPGVQAYDFTFG